MRRTREQVIWDFVQDRIFGYTGDACTGSGTDPVEHVFKTKEIKGQSKFSTIIPI